jgi:hypothetical protein
MLVMDEQRLLNSSPEYMDQFERLVTRIAAVPAFLYGASVTKKVGYMPIAQVKELPKLSLQNKKNWILRAPALMLLTWEMSGKV